jgi:L-alanine-DL-glutamate epimerase-like enolase superfamily enzyme
MPVGLLDDQPGGDLEQLKQREVNMKITKLETIWFDEQPNTIWVRIHTDDGLIGLGETYYVPRAVKRSSS